jgi:uncharacterized protein
MSKPDRFLVVAHSARLLAQSAARGRHRVCALDLFHDADTGRFALDSEAVAARAGESPGFDQEDLLRRAARLCPPSCCLGLVYGAGFEDDTETLARLAHGRTLFGNRPELVAQLKEPAAFFDLLDRLAVPHPTTTLSEPADPRGWLYKCRGATGGAHVIDATAVNWVPPASAGVAATAGKPGAAGYFQRREAGRNLSLLFLADGRHAEVIGISEQLTRSNGFRRYIYAGAVGPVRVPAAVAHMLRDALEALVSHTGLVGCNSLDFLLDGNRPAVLEINPRPSATLDLYDHHWNAGLFDAHVKACRGELAAAACGSRAARVRAQVIVYASASMRIGPDVAFPPWCSDIPYPGTSVQADAPVCTVNADGVDVSSARRQLGRRRRQIEFKLRQRLTSGETENGCKSSATKREPQRRAPGHSAAGAA